MLTGSPKKAIIIDDPLKKDRALLLYFLLSDLPHSFVRLPTHTSLECIDWNGVDVEKILKPLYSGSLTRRLVPSFAWQGKISTYHRQSDYQRKPSLCRPLLHACARRRRFETHLCWESTRWGGLRMDAAVSSNRAVAAAFWKDCTPWPSAIRWRQEQLLPVRPP